MQVTPSHTFEDFSSLCEIVCTSQKTLLAHAAGGPHRKKVKRQALIDNPPKEEEEGSKVEKSGKSVTKSDVKKSEKRRIQKELGLMILKKYGPKLTTKKFIKKFNKRTRNQPDLASDIIKRVRILTSLFLTLFALRCGNYRILKLQTQSYNSRFQKSEILILSN